MLQPAGAGSISDQRPVSPADLGLTERQMDVLTLIMQGKSNKAISAILRARKRPGDGDLPEAPSPAAPPSPTRGLGPQGALAHKGRRYGSCRKNHRDCGWFGPCLGA